MLDRIRKFLRGFVDIREGEALRVLFTALYLLCVLFAYYILKTTSRALFLNKLDIDKLPLLSIFIAVVGGLLAYVYTKVAVKTSLQTAVTGATVVSIACIVPIWLMLRYMHEEEWTYYTFNVWVSLFSITFVTQGWLVAANIFNPREAKRLYGALGVASVIGATFGSAFTAAAVRIVGTDNLIFASAAMILLAYVMFRMVARQPGVKIGQARAAGEEEASFSFGDIVQAIGHYRHLQVIIGIICLTYIVDTVVDYQFSAMAKEAYKGDKDGLTAYLASFSFVMNIVNFIFQFFLTAFIVSRFGVGGTLQVMPLSISVTSLVTLFVPHALSTALVRLTEAATRYTFNRTGMELLYLPLPTELKNRTKAFVDIFVDRLSRGMGGMLLLLLNSKWFNIEVNHMSLVVIGLCGVWTLLSWRAQREYVTTVRKRLESRRLDLADARINVGDPGTVKLLEQTADSANPRQAIYALALLAETPGYRVEPLLRKMAASASEEVRARVYDVARGVGFAELLDKAMAEIRANRAGSRSAAVQPAVAYALKVSPESSELTTRLMNHPNNLVAESALETLVENPVQARQVITAEWLRDAANDKRPERRCLAAIAVRVRGDESTAVLHSLLADADPRVVEAAFRSASALQQRAYLEHMVRHLANPRLRGAAINGLAAFGVRIVGTLGDILEDETVPVAIRRQMPRALRLIADQRAVDVLLRSIGEPNLTVREAVLRGLNKLRQSHPALDYGVTSVTQQILAEARHYFELSSALAPFREQNKPHTPAGLLVGTLEERLLSTIERLFRLLGMRYAPKEIYAAYLAVHHGKSEEFSAAMEFLDNMLDRDVKRFVLPLLDSPTLVLERGRELFGVERKTPESAIRELIRGGDAWLVCCAAATAAQLKIKSLAPDIAQLNESCGAEVGQVARAAAAALA